MQARGKPVSAEVAEKRCTVCGAPFRAPPSSKTRTCSKPCSSIHRSRAHIGVRNRWSDEARARLSERGQTANLRKGTPAARASDKAGPFASNVTAREWTVIAPTGEVYVVRNLRLWCETHAAMFAPDPWRAAYAGLRQAAAYLRGTTKRRVGGYKGWRIDRPDLPADGEAALRQLMTSVGDKMARIKR